MRVALLPVLGLVACASTPAPPQVPDSLKPPAGQVLQLEALASGVQIYDCAAKPDGSGLAWTFRAPEATLVDRAGKSLGKHYAGPTWESVDGSLVVGEVKARAPGPTPATAIPWLLLMGKSHALAIHSDAGATVASTRNVFAAINSIQRVDTGGGVAPAAACTADKLGQSARVPYTATYYFYR
jgi:hypothetical protein